MRMCSSLIRDCGGYVSETSEWILSPPRDDTEENNLNLLQHNSGCVGTLD